MDNGRIPTTPLKEVCEFILLLNFFPDAVGHGVEEGGGTFGLFLQRRGAPLGSLSIQDRWGLGSRPVRLSGKNN